MADNSVALGRSSGPDFFADDDPLAELARIAGYDEKPVRRPENAAPARREPAFNLEDELLLELERYDSPRLDPVADIPVAPAAVHAPAAASAAQPQLQPRVMVQQPVALDPFADDEPVAPRAEPMFTPRAAEPVAQPSISQADSILPSLSANRQPIPVAPAGRPEEFGLDLISELEGSLSAPAVAVAPKSGRPPARAYEPGFRMPIANFNLAQTRLDPGMTASVAASAMAPVASPVGLMPTAVAAPAPVESLEDWESEFDLGAAMEAELNADPQPVEVASVSGRHEPAAPVVPAVSVELSSATLSALQEAVSDVDHYSNLRKPDVAPAVAVPSPAVMAPEQKPAAVAPPVAAAPVVAPAVAASPPVPELADEEFELALDDLELDFSDLMVDDAVSAPVAAQPVAAPPTVAPQMVAQPVPQHTARMEPAAAVSPTLAASVPAFLATSRSAASVAPAPAPAQAAFEDRNPAPDAFAIDSDAFDPSLLADTEDMPEAVADLNVPEIPVHEPEQPVAPQHDYDLDLDAELASFLETANAPPQSAVAPAPKMAAQPAQAAAPAMTENKKFEDGLDEFERALEEDFRRSLSTPLMRKTLDDRHDSDDMPYVTPRRSLSAWMMPLSIAGFVGVAGLSFYAWYASEGGRLSGDGAPVVIAADTEPVKVVPENPGGKTVPNQDKAVYDRVASGTLGDPKQAALITSDEQPVDVVQKTLVPEGFSLEGEEEGQDGVTQVADTQDARLMPEQVQAAAVNGGGHDQLAVMPRRVKTMIVRPDGTLVEQVSDVPAEAAGASATVRSEKMPAAPALAEPMQTASTGQLAPVSGQPASQLADVDVATTTAVTPAALPAATGTPAKGMPVPSTRPSDQPVKVVAAVSDQGNVQSGMRPTTAPAAPATVQTASVQPAQKPAATTGAGGYFVQIASLPSEADAQKSYRNLSSKFSGVIGGKGVDIARADVSGKGTFYRVRIPAGSKDEAAALCEKYRAAGGTCLIAR